MGGAVASIDIWGNRYPCCNIIERVGLPGDYRVDGIANFGWMGWTVWRSI
jgi:hypothetical protein